MSAKNVDVEIDGVIASCAVYLGDGSHADPDQVDIENIWFEWDGDIRVGPLNKTGDHIELQIDLPDALQEYLINDSTWYGRVQERALEDAR